MSINDYRPQELIEQRKKVSDSKNDTDKLTHPNDGKNGTRAAAYKASRELKDKREIEKLCDDSKYWEDLIDD